MERFKNTKAPPILILTFFTFLMFVFSCSPDLEPDENSEAANAVANFKSVLKELVKGAPIHAANGINIGPDGNLYIASFLGQEIVVLDKQNGTILNRLKTESGVLGPDDLVFGPDGSLYWTDIVAGEVGRMTPDGVITKQLVSQGVNPITFSPEGRLFVALDFLGDGLFELDPNLVDPPRPIITASPGNPFPLGFLNAFEFGPDGLLYGPLFAAGLVVKVDVGNPGDPPSTDPFNDGTVQVISGGYFNPAAAKFGPDGLLYVVDQSGGLFQIDIQTGEKTLFETYQPGLDNMVFDTDGTLYISNNDHGWVAEILPSRQARIISDGGIIAPQGLAVFQGPNNNDAVFVADHFNLRNINGSSGQEDAIYKGYLVPQGPESLVIPMNLTADGDNLIVSSYFSGSVQIVNPQNGEVLQVFPMAAPIDVIPFQNDILATDIGLGGLAWASNNNVIIPVDNANFFLPSGLATDGDTVWMADWGSGIVWQIDFNGSTPETPFPVATGLSNPEGLTYDGEGRLLVVESGAGRLSRIDLSNGSVTEITSGIGCSEPATVPFLPPVYLFDDVEMGPSGDVYVSGSGDGVVYRIRANKLN